MPIDALPNDLDIDKGGPAPIAHEALERIAVLYAIESRIRGRSAEERRAVRRAETKPLVEKLKAWLETRLIAVSEKSTNSSSILLVSAAQALQLPRRMTALP